MIPEKPKRTLCVGFGLEPLTIPREDQEREERMKIVAGEEKNAKIGPLPPNPSGLLSVWPNAALAQSGWAQVGRYRSVNVRDTFQSLARAIGATISWTPTRRSLLLCVQQLIGIKLPVHIPQRNALRNDTRKHVCWSRVQGTTQTKVGR